MHFFFFLFSSLIFRICRLYCWSCSCCCFILSEGCYFYRFMQPATTTATTRGPAASTANKRIFQPKLNQTLQFVFPSNSEILSFFFSRRSQPMLGLLLVLFALYISNGYTIRRKILGDTSIISLFVVVVVFALIGFVNHLSGTCDQRGRTVVLGVLIELK